MPLEPVPPPESPPRPERLLTVVVASVEAEGALREVLSALVASCDEVAAEILVIDASTDRSAELAASFGGAITLLHQPPGTLVPALWAEGIRRSRGRYVALTTGHCIVPGPWARELIAALAGGAGGAGAGLSLAPRARALDRAVFYLRYAAFIDQTHGEVRRTLDLAGDNAAYHGDRLRSFCADHDHGFWEIEYHRHLHETGETLEVRPAAGAALGRSFPLGTILRHRYEHGTHHGGWRVRSGGEPRARVVLAAPLVPFVLLARTVRRVARRRGHRLSLLRATPPFLLLAAAWALGEAVGAARTRPRDGVS